jgi:hypothetical protein
MGGSFIRSPREEEEVVVSGLAKGEGGWKLSRGFASGGDMRLETGRRFMMEEEEE